MPQFERRLYEPEDLGMYDGSDDDMEEEGSRLPLLIVIALVVLASFAGVVWLAYTQGVQRGREDAPRIVAVQQNKLAATESKNPYSNLKIYQSPKDNDEASDETAASAQTPSVPNAAVPEHPLSKPVVMPRTNVPTAKPKTEDISKSVTEKPQAARPAAVTPKNTAPAATGTPRVITPPPATPKKAVPQTNAKSTAPTDTAMINKVLAAQQTPTTQQAPAAQQAPKTQRAGYVLQIGSYTSEAEANASWQTYKAAHSSVAGFAPDVAQAN
ncbi:MAG TPA: hypothetical protein VHW69_17210, partial [Rhizomicrobium sp.]|nr:hypothetical protein [Rhizomicrobium sp.]